jgi:hypothetical protein
MLSGNDLERWCVPGSTFCAGYVLGFSSGLMMADSLRGICMPKEVTAGQMLDVVRAYTKANPKNRHWPLEAIVGIAYSLRAESRFVVSGPHLEPRPFRRGHQPGDPHLGGAMFRFPCS